MARSTAFIVSRQSGGSSKEVMTDGLFHAGFMHDVELDAEPHVVKPDDLKPECAEHAVAHALVRAVPALMPAQASRATTGVHTSVNAARTSACATTTTATTTTKTT